jgi:divalent metal cation (Fe/Co/Zn/Cd) transporter
MNAAVAGSRPGLHRQAVRLEQFSIGWMLVEAGAAVTAGLIAGSLALTSFGFDSVIELVCATLAATTLLGLVLFTTLGWWWADPIAALAVAYFAVREGGEAWRGELVCDG